MLKRSAADDGPNGGDKKRRRIRENVKSSDVITAITTHYSNSRSDAAQLAELRTLIIDFSSTVKHDADASKAWKSILEVLPQHANIKSDELKLIVNSAYNSQTLSKEEWTKLANSVNEHNHPELHSLYTEICMHKAS